MADQKASPESSYQTIFIVWAALLFSQFIFAVLVYFVKPELRQLDLSAPLLGDQPAIVVVFASVGVLSLILGQILKGRVLERSVAEQNVGLVQTATIVASALAEVSSLLGVMLAFAFGYRYFLAFIVVGIVGVLMAFPRRSQVHAASFKRL